MEVTYFLDLRGSPIPTICIDYLSPRIHNSVVHHSQEVEESTDGQMCTEKVVYGSALKRKEILT